MTVPGKGDPTKASQTESNAAPANRGKAEGARNEQPRDLIPPALLIGIFAAVMLVTWFLLADNWINDMTRYRSIKAQRDGNWEQATVMLKKLIQAGEEQENDHARYSPTYFSELGNAYLQMENYQESLENFQKAQQYRTNMPTDDQGNPYPAPHFENRIGHVYYKLGDLESAEKFLTAALQVDKLDPLANYTLGEIAMDRGNYIKAAEYFKVVAEHPHYEKQVTDNYAEIEQKLFANIK